MRTCYVRAAQICAAAALCWAGVAGPSPPAAADAPDLDEIMGQIGTSQSEADDLHAEYLRGLQAVEASIDNCRRFLNQHGDDPEVRAILRRIREQPNDVFFTEPTTIGDLAEAVGDDIALSQQDLEICLRARDDGLGDPNEQQAASFGRIEASLDRCLQALDQIGPDPDGVAILQGASRRPADPTYTSAQTLARLERAVGDLALTPRDLETCADAFHQNVALEQSPLVGDNPPPCTSGETPCPTGPPGSGGSCCSAGENCVLPTCRNCEAYCQTPACFPATATVRLEDGAQKAMRDVRLGDRIMVARADGSLGYEDVYLNTHKDSVSATPYVELALASGQSLTLSPRHFIPIAPEAGAGWESRVLKGANEVEVGDVVWHQGSDGAMLATTVTAVTETVETGAFNPLTLSGTIVVDGVVASAHSNWFLDGVVSADLQGRIYQAMFAPVRGIYHLIGPEWTETIAEDWGVVDFARERTSPQSSGSGLPWALVGALLLAGVSIVVFRRARRPVLR